MEIENDKILGIKLFNVNDNYIEFSKNTYAIDAAIEIQLSSKTISFGWNFENEGIELSQKAYPTNTNAYELDIDEFTGIKSLIGKSFLSLKSITTDFDMIIDYTMKTERTTLVTGIEINFDESFKTIISACTFMVDPRNRIPLDILPNLQGNLLIDIGKSFH